MKKMTTVGIVLMAIGFVIVLFNETPEPAPITHTPIHGEPKETYDPYVIFDSIFVDLNYNYTKTGKGLHYTLSESEDMYNINQRIDSMITWKYGIPKEWATNKEALTECLMTRKNWISQEHTESQKQMVLDNITFDGADMIKRIKEYNRITAIHMVLITDESRPIQITESLKYLSHSVFINLRSELPPYVLNKYTDLIRISDLFIATKKQGKSPTKLILSEGDRLIINSYGDIKSITILGIECVVEDGERTEFICEEAAR